MNFGLWTIDHGPWTIVQPSFVVQEVRIDEALRAIFTLLYFIMFYRLREVNIPCSWHRLS
jgi:hypothetical protein